MHRPQRRYAKWNGGRCGNGQLVLFPDQNVPLVPSEVGELALVRVTPDQFTELARFKVIEGKTWNHPILVCDVLLVRNGKEMAAFGLSLAGRWRRLPSPPSRVPPNIALRSFDHPIESWLIQKLTSSALTGHGYALTP